MSIVSEVYDALLEAGASEAKAKAAAAAIPVAEHLATKEDIAELKAEIAGLKVAMFTFGRSFWVVGQARVLPLAQVYPVDRLFCRFWPYFGISMLVSC